jgi:hypothetical protein
VIGSEALEELGYLPRITKALSKLDIRSSLPGSQAGDAAPGVSAPEPAAA